MKAKRFLLLVLGLLFCGRLAAVAGEFPDSWTWDTDQPVTRTEHAALEGKPMPPLQVTGWINGEVNPPI